MSRTLWLLGTFCINAVLIFALPAYGVNLTISCGAVGQERALCEQAVQDWSEQSGHSVSVSSPPTRTNERYFKYLIELGNHDDSIDVFQIDVIWPGLLANHFIDLNRYLDTATVQQHFPAIIANNTVAERLVGLPWYTDVGVLYYRQDLLQKYNFEVPETWSDLADTALIIQSEERKAGNNDVWGFVFQGAKYEGLTCNALEWISSYGGGEIVEKDGAISINNPFSQIALGRAASWVGTIAPKRVTTFTEEDARILAQQGNAVFMRNWPYAWALLNSTDSPVAGKVGVAPLPKGGSKGQSRGTLGGWQLAVSTYSEHPQEAAELVAFLSSEKVQKQRAIDGSYAPTLMSLYDDPEVLNANPFFATLKPLLENAVARPTSQTRDNYMAVTTRFWDMVHAVLQGSQSASDGLAALEDQLKGIRGRGW